MTDTSRCTLISIMTPLWLLLILTIPSSFSSDTKRPLSKPDIQLCQTRPDKVRFGGHRYLFSWTSNSEQEERDWIAARNFCRKRCMDTLAIDTREEWNFILGQMGQLGSLRLPDSDEEQAFSVWTSGRLCDFEGCEKLKSVFPHNVNGWFWSASNQRMAPTNCVDGDPNCFHAWSDNGKYGFAQPDNRELREDGLDGNESCMAILVNAYGEGPVWHDRACYHKAHFICEDSGILLNYAKRKFKKANL